MRATTASYLKPLQEVWRVSKSQSIVAVALMVFGGLCEGAALLCLMPLLSLLEIAPLANVSVPGASLIAQVFHYTGVSLNLYSVLCFYGVMMLAVSYARYRRSVFTMQLREAVVLHLRSQLLEAISFASLESLKEIPYSKISAASLLFIDRISFLVFEWLNLIAIGIMLAVYGISIYWASGFVTLGALLFFVIPSYWVWRYQKQTRGLGAKSAELVETNQRLIEEHLRGISLIKSACQEAYELTRLKIFEEKVAQHHIRFYERHAFHQMVMMWIMLAQVIGFLAVCVLLIHIPIASLLTVTMILLRSYPRLSEVPNKWVSIAHFTPFYAEVAQLIAKTKEQREHFLPNQQLLRLQHTIELQNVSYAYRGSTKPVLSNMSCRIQAHQLTVIWGLSGIGKTTLANLLSGLVMPTSGRLVVDGQPVSSQQLLNWRLGVTYLSQEGPRFFTGTLRENLIWPGKPIRDQELWEALSLVGLDNTVRGLKLGLSTVITDNANHFSGGQKQRLALAWALLRKPQLLLLDEATHALDPHHINIVMKAIEQIKQTTTVVMITHQLQWKERADCVLCLREDVLQQQAIGHELRGEFNNEASDYASL